LEHGHLIEDPDKNVSDDELILVRRKLELGSEGRIANSPPDRRGPFRLDELGQLGSCAVVPDQVGTLDVRVQDFQNLKIVDIRNLSRDGFL
jgi:hypothetical protein